MYGSVKLYTLCYNVPVTFISLRFWILDSYVYLKCPSFLYCTVYLSQFIVSSRFFMGCGFVLSPSTYEFVLLPFLPYLHLWGFQLRKGERYNRKIFFTQSWLQYFSMSWSSAVKIHLPNHNNLIICIAVEPKVFIKDPGRSELCAIYSLRWQRVSLCPLVMVRLRFEV